ncbi:MAG: thioesterase family protein [Pseudomonadota bacterium]
MANLAEATRVADTDGELSSIIDNAWSIWGPISGYVAAIALRAVGAMVPAGHRPVTFTCQYVARGNAGPVSIDVIPIKSGGTACHHVQLQQEGRPFLFAQVWTTARAGTPVATAPVMPDVPPPDTLQPVDDLFRRHGHDVADFWKVIDGRQVDFRAVDDTDPRGGRTERWLRIKEWTATDDPFLDAARALIGIDTHIWPAHVRSIAGTPPYVAPSLDLCVWFHSAVPSSPWQLIEARADVIGDSLLSGTARAWSEDGQLIASGGSQCLVVPKRPA